jgi:hypothetical protein
LTINKLGNEPAVKLVCLLANPISKSQIRKLRMDQSDDNGPELERSRLCPLLGEGFPRLFAVIGIPE